MVKQGWKWLQSQKHLCSCVCAAMQCFVGKTEAFAERHWPLVCSGCGKLLGFLSLSFLYWKDCVLRGFQSSAKFGSAALLLIMWSCFLSLTSVSCLVYVLLGMVRPPLDPSSVLNRIELSLLIFIIAGSCWCCCCVLRLHSWDLHCRTVWDFDYVDVR